LGWHTYAVSSATKQSANETSKSTRTALHNVVICTIKHKEIALGVFHDTEVGFDRTSLEATTQGAVRHSAEPIICGRILIPT
jgi:hypothetical protein